MVVFLLFLWMTRSIFVTVFLGLLFGVSITPAVDWLERLRVPRGAGAGLVVLALFGVLAGIGALLAPVLQEQAAELRMRIPQALDRLDRELLRRHLMTTALEGGPQTQQPVQSPAPKRAAGKPATAQTSEAAEAAALLRSPLRVILARQVGGVLPYLFPVFSTALSALTGIILVVFLAIFFAADPLTYMRGVLHLIPRTHRPRMTAVLETMGRTLRAWVIARLIAMLTIGVVVTGTMALLGVRAAVALGVIAGLLEFVPVFGPVIGAIPAIALAFADSPQKAVAVAIAFLIIQQLEGNVLIPMLLQKAVEVPPALSLIGIASMAVVLGILGVLIAEPLVAAALVAVKMLYVESVIGDRVRDEARTQVPEQGEKQS